MDLMMNPIPGGKDGKCAVTVSSGFDSRNPSHARGAWLAAATRNGSSVEASSAELKECKAKHTAADKMAFMLKRTDWRQQNFLTRL
jgi:hypothetical protein